LDTKKLKVIEEEQEEFKSLLYFDKRNFIDKAKHFK